MRRHIRTDGTNEKFLFSYIIVCSSSVCVCSLSKLPSTRLLLCMVEGGIDSVCDV
jgi:hypothetical protein